MRLGSALAGFVPLPFRAKKTADILKGKELHQLDMPEFFSNAPAVALTIKTRTQQYGGQNFMVLPGVSERKTISHAERRAVTSASANYYLFTMLMLAEAATWDGIVSCRSKQLDVTGV